MYILIYRAYHLLMINVSYDITVYFDVVSLLTFQFYKCINDGIDI